MSMRGDGLGRRTSQNSQEPRRSLLPTPALSSTNRLPLIADKKPTPPSSHSPFTAIRMASDVGTITERLHIADKLSRARPDLVVPSYAPKRTRQLSWSLRSESREQHPDDLRSTSHATMVDTTVQAAIPDHSLSSTDVFEDDSGMDWERSRVLADTVLAQIERGEPVSLPALTCLNSQLPDAP
jgi:hypothetical protein